MFLPSTKMKTELLRSYSTNNFSSLSRTSSKIDLAAEQSRGGSNSSNANANSNSNSDPAQNGKSDCNLNITGESQEKQQHQETSWGLGACCPPKPGSLNKLENLFPVIRWFPHYSVAKLLADFVAGITIGLTVLPQGLAYASLAGLPPQYGLYSSFVGCFTYIFTGSTKSITVGPTAVLAIMTLSYSSGKPPEYGVLLGLLTGIMTLCMGLFRLGFIVNFISAPVNSAFTAAAAITICSTQVKALLGLHYPAEGFLGIVIGAMEHIPDMKMTDSLLSLVCIVILLILQHLPNIFSKLNQTHPKIHKVLWLVSVARNAIVIVVCTVVFTLEGMAHITPVETVGNITSGLPPFQFPSVYFVDPRNNITHTFGMLLKEDASAIIVMPLLAIMEHITIAKAFAGTSRVGANQEMVSIGLANIIGSFFSSMTVTGSFSRTTVNLASGVQSPIGGLFTGIMVLLSLQFLTPYFYYIPKASLGAVIVCAVISMVDFSVLYPMWKTKKMDLLPWLVTFITSLVVGLEFGIVTGLIVSIVFLLYYAARPGVRVSKCETLSGAKFIMVSTDRSLVFPATEYTMYIIMKSGQVWGNGSLPVVIDCQHIQYADFTAALGIRDLFKLFNEKNQELILWQIKPSIVRILTQVLEVANVPFQHCSTEEELEASLLNSQLKSKIGNMGEHPGKIKFTIPDEDMDMDRSNAMAMSATNPIEIDLDDEDDSSLRSPPGSGKPTRRKTNQIQIPHQPRRESRVISIPIV